MSYFYRQRLAKRFWREEAHPRGKTTERSTPGSFAPADAVAVADRVSPKNAGGRKLTEQAKGELKEVQHIMYRRLAHGRPYTRQSFEGDLQYEVREALGVGFEGEAKDMAERLWDEYHAKGPHQYHEPRSWMKADVQL